GESLNAEIEDCTRWASEQNAAKLTTSLENFVKLNIYMRDLRVKTLQQQEGYTVIGMLGDIGGSMGMFIGASIITIFEAVDMLLFALARRRRERMIGCQQRTQAMERPS
ncbi:hypothetical protein LSAT2_013443, partial [Lamellibrachia satsuma]